MLIADAFTGNFSFRCNEDKRRSQWSLENNCHLPLKPAGGWSAHCQPCSAWHCLNIEDCATSTSMAFWGTINQDFSRSAVPCLEPISKSICTKAGQAAAKKYRSRNSFRMVSNQNFQSNSTVFYIIFFQICWSRWQWGQLPVSALGRPTGRTQLGMAVFGIWTNRQDINNSNLLWHDLKLNVIWIRSSFHLNRIWITTSSQPGRAKMVVSKTPGPGQYEIPTTLIGTLVKLTEGNTFVFRFTCFCFFVFFFFFFFFSEMLETVCRIFFGFWFFNFFWVSQHAVRILQVWITRINTSCFVVPFSFAENAWKCVEAQLVAFSKWLRVISSFESNKRKHASVLKFELCNMCGLLPCGQPAWIWKIA